MDSRRQSTAVPPDGSGAPPPAGSDELYGFGATTSRETDLAQDKADDQHLSSFGYRARFARTIRPFDSFAAAFSIMCISNTVFATYAYTLVTAGPRGIWAWPVAVLGTLCVALIYGVFASRVPLAGQTYQWGSRFGGPYVGWAFGWMAFSFLSILTVSVNYGLVESTLVPLLGLESQPVLNATLTIAVIGSQAVLILLSTPLTARINNIAVITEIFGVVQLVLVLVIASLVARLGDVGNLTSTGTVPAEGWFGWMGPFMLAILPGAYGITAWEVCADLSEETRNPRRNVPRAMVFGILVTGICGMFYFAAITVAASDIPGLSGDTSPVATLVGTYFGGAETIVLAWVAVSSYTCGSIIMIANSRQIWALARDRRFPGHQLFALTPRKTGAPLAILPAAVVSTIIVLAFMNNAAALLTLLTSATILAAVSYLAAVILYLRVRDRLLAMPGEFGLGRWEKPVVAGALLWLGFELTVLLGAPDFRESQIYALVILGVGLLCFVLMMLLEPKAMRTRVINEAYRPASQPPAPRTGIGAPNRRSRVGTRS